jgi:hypothetical protein
MLTEHPREARGEGVPIKRVESQFFKKLKNVERILTTVRFTRSDVTAVPDGSRQRIWINKRDGGVLDEMLHVPRA